MTRTRNMVLALAFTLISSSAGALEGTWVTEDGEARVRFDQCGAAVCGRIVWLRKPNDPETNRPILDSKNGDPALRSRPVLGLTLLNVRAEGGRWAGEIYDPSSGRTFMATISPMDASRLRLQGCVLGGLLCQSQTWTRHQ